MKVRLQAGAELDLLNSREMEDVLSRVLIGWRAEISRGVRFRQFTGRGIVAAGTWTISPTDADDNVLGPDPGMLWSVTQVAVSGTGIVAGTDLFSLYLDEITPTRLIQNRLGLSGTGQWDIGGLVLGGGSKLAAAGPGTGAGSEVWLAGRAVELPVQLAWQLL